jgi:hypothetical protein
MDGPRCTLPMCGAAVFFSFRFSYPSVLFLRVLYETPTVPSATHNRQQSFIVRPCCSVVAFIASVIVEQIVAVVKKYEERLRGLPFVPRFWYGSQMLRQDRAPNRLFFTYLFSDQAIAIYFLKDVGLPRSRVLCNICDRRMTWSTDPNLA